MKEKLLKEANSWWQATGGGSAEYYESADFRNNTQNL
jgi:hypothetical protein